MEKTVYLSDHSWYAIHVKSRHEFRVVDELKKASREAFLPVVERIREWKDRKKRVAFPLFPGYLFVHIAKGTDERLAVLKTKSVVKLLGTIPGEPEAVPDEQITALKRLTESKQSLEAYPYLKEGQVIRIRTGALAGVEGILVERSGQHMLVVSVDILRQGVSLKIDASGVEPV